ncbi:hypothetical protein Tco_0516629 [Tanacetum coccineum]
MEESLPTMVDDRVKELTKTQERENLRSEITLQINDAISNNMPSHVDSSVRNYIPSVVRLRDQDDPRDDAHPEGENSVKRQKTSEHGSFVESSFGQDFKVNQVHQLQKGSAGPEKIMMSLHKFPVVIFPDDDIEERTSR